MSHKVFTLETIAAKHGDCLMLHWGDTDDPRLMLIDGGPSGVYNRFLKKRINELRETRSDPLKLDYVMISHVDDDHIRGILDLTGKMEDAEDRGRDPICEIDEMWFNSFDDVLGNVEAAAFRTDMNAANISPDHRHTAASIASVRQGRALRDRANRLGLRVNGGDSLIVDGWIWDMGDGLSFTVVGPRRAQIDEFQEAWDKEVKKKGWDVSADEAGVASYLDRSPYNLASTVVLAEVRGKTMLLTGDARGDHILDGLRENWLLTGSSMKVDLLKVPHHGSDNNVKTDFFRAVKADHYVISGDGHHGNPEIATLQMIRSARGSDPYTVHMTYRHTRHGHEHELDEFLGALSTAERRKFVFRGADDLSFKIELGAPLAD